MEKTKRSGIENVKAEVVEEKTDTAGIMSSVKDMFEKASAPFVAYFDNNRAYTQSEIASYEKEIEIEMRRLESSDLTDEQRAASHDRIDALRGGKSQAVKDGRTHDFKGAKIVAGVLGTVAIVGVAAFDQKLASSMADNLLKAGKILKKAA